MKFKFQLEITAWHISNFKNPLEMAILHFPGFKRIIDVEFDSLDKLVFYTKDNYFIWKISPNLQKWLKKEDKPPFLEEVTLTLDSTDGNVCFIT